MNRNVSILSVLVMMAVTVMATAAVAFAVPNEGSNGQPKVPICHNGHTITVGEPAVAAHLENHGDAEGTCEEEPTPGPGDGITLTTVATESATLPDELISDTATLSGGDNPTGTITFNVYGPDDEDCSGEPAFTSEVDVDGDGDYTSDPFTPTAAGTYRWTADYSGDDSNDPVSSECNAEGEQSVVNDAQTTTPTLTTVATESATLPDEPISDTATLSGATSDATGTITFSAYGPFDPATDPTTDVCDETNLAFESDPVDIGSPDATSGDYVVSSDDPAVTTDDFVPSEAGRYQWVASYTSGDANNEDVSSVCNAEGEQSVVAEAPTTTATEQLTTLALDHKEQRLLEIKEKLRADETPQEQKEALQERRKQLREVLYG